MSATVTAPDATASAVDEIRKPRFGMRAKMLLAFAVALTVLFALFGWFIIAFIGRQAEARIVTELTTFAQGSAKVTDTEALAALMKQLPAYNPENPYPVTDERYVALSKQLYNIKTAVGGTSTFGTATSTFSPYTYTMGPDGKLQWLNTYGVLNENGQLLNPVPTWANGWRAPVADTFQGSGGENSQAYQMLQQGLQGTVQQSEYCDDNGCWISVYTPITDANGTVIAGMATDIGDGYVQEQITKAAQSIIPGLIVIYLLLLGLIFIISTLVTRPLKRLTNATELVAAGDYDINLAETVKTRWPDEMTVLAHSFGQMVEKVRAREKNLTTQVRKLKVEIDSKKREQSVNEITDSDFFASLSAKAASQRQRNSEMEKIDDDASTPMKPVV